MAAELSIQLGVGDWYMNVPLRGGVRRASNESLGAISGAKRLSEPANPATPSK